MQKTQASRWQILFAILLFYSSISAQTPDSVTTVNVAYGEQDARTVTSAISHLERKDFNQGQIYDWNQLWQGLVPGFTVARAGSNPNEPFDTRIRNLHTLSLRAQPLYVVDGVPGVDLLAIDPADVVSVDVLRDAASTAIYGGRGAAGVVLINTRAASTRGIKATYRGQLSSESAAKRYEVLDEAAFIQYGGADYSPNSVENTDWQDLVLRNGISQAHHLGLSGGTGNGGFLRVSLNYRNLEGILRGSDFQQYNGNMLVSQKILKDKITLSGGVTLASREADLGFPEAFRYAIVANPSSPVRSDDPIYDRYGGYFEKELFDYFNPVAIIEQNKNEEQTTYHLGHLRAEARLLPGLTAALLLAKEQSQTRRSEFYSKQSRFRGNYRNGLGRNALNRNGQEMLEATLQYKFAMSRLRAQLLGGYGWQQTDRDGYDISAGNIISNVLENNNFNSFGDIGKGLANISSYRWRTRLISFFGRAQLQWNDAYFLSFGARRDGASQLGDNAEWGIFPFFSAGLDAAKLLKMRGFQQLKLRIGAGTSGNAPQQSGLSTDVLGPGSTFYYNGSYVPSYGIRQNANPNLGWERHGEFSAGLDFSTLKGRLSRSFDWYHYKSKGLIISRSAPVPPNFAFITYENAGELSGKGVEISLNYEVVKQQNFTWEAGLTAAHSITTIETLGRKDSISIAGPGAPGQCCAYYILAYPGAQFGTFWGPVTNGELNQNGQFIYQDIDGNGQFDLSSFNRDQTFLGSAQPKWEFGLRQQIGWRRFDLNFLLRGATGHFVANEVRLFYENLDPTTFTWNKVVTKYFDENNKSQNRLSNRHIEKASFLRLQYAALGYRFRLREKSWFDGLQLQIGAQNLFTLTKYAGLDPELRLGDVGSSDNGGRSLSLIEERNPLAPGIERRTTYPSARVWWVGVKAEF